MWGLERGYCLMIGGPDDGRRPARPALPVARARGSTRPAGRPAGPGEPSPAEQGYLHCGPSGAGHFVKMVHNGIEYGLMAAYAEGLNILRHAGRGPGHARRSTPRPRRCASPSSTSTSSTCRPSTEVWRRGSVIASWLLDLTAQAFLQSPDLAELRGARVGLRRGPLDEHRRDRRERAGARPDHGAVRPFLVPRRGRLRRPGPVGDAPRLRRPPRDSRARRSPGR